MGYGTLTSYTWCCCRIYLLQFLLSFRRKTSQLFSMMHWLAHAWKFRPTHYIFTNKRIAYSYLWHVPIIIFLIIWLNYFEIFQKRAVMVGWRTCQNSLAKFLLQLVIGIFSFSLHSIDLHLAKTATVDFDFIFFLFSDSTPSYLLLDVPSNYIGCFQLTIFHHTDRNILLIGRMSYQYCNQDFRFVIVIETHP